MSQEGSDLSRRQFISRTIGSGVAISLYSKAATVVPASGSSGLQEDGRIVIHLNAPAGPPPYGAPAELSIPFPPQRLREVRDLIVVAPSGQPVTAQFHPVLHWPDGSVRWLAVAFDPLAGPGDYVLQPGEPSSAPDLLRIEGEHIIMDTGEMVLAVAGSGEDWLQVLGAPDPTGKMAPIVRGRSSADILLTRHDGKVFRSSNEGEERNVIVEDRGAVRGSIRIEGKCRASDGERLFDYIIHCTAYRGRPELFLTVIWINTTSNPSEQLRDIRINFPFDFEPDRLVIGCERGVYDGPFLKDRSTSILQDDYDRYCVRENAPNGRLLNLSSGGCNGEHSPGWLYMQNQKRCLGIWVPNFWEEYPNEIAVRQGELSVGLWPERAIDHLLSKPLLPANPQGTPYSMTKYWPILPHPYWAFLDREKKCLDAPQGLAKTQEIVLSVWGGRGKMPAFEKKWWSKSLQHARGHLDPQYVASTGALGKMCPRDPKNLPAFEKLLEESFGWFNRHIDLQKCYGKFDYGDFKYFTAATDYMCYPGTKWGEMGEMPREGYWHNNERDPLLGMLLYYYRSGDPQAWERGRISARHLLDVDIRHFPHWGMYTHSYGHCYVATADAGEPDHSWLLGLLLWSGASGDSVTWDWMKRCGERLRSLKIDFAQTDARTAAVYLHMMCQFYQYTSENAYLSAAKPPVEALLQYQNSNGSWPAYLGNLKQPRIEGFVEHTVMALSDFYVLTKDERVLRSLDRAIVHLFGPDGNGKPDEGESPLALYGLALLAEETGLPKYSATATKVLSKLCASQNLSPDPIGRGDMIAQWEVNNPERVRESGRPQQIDDYGVFARVNNPERARESGRPPQFLGQTRPLSPACILAYGSPALTAVAKAVTGSGSHQRPPSHL
jgi:hypothetical protein